MTRVAPDLRLSSETIHASCIAIDMGGRMRGVLIAGQSGAGKSDLALRLIDRGARLVSDDYSFIRRLDGRIVASPPDTIRGKIEVRGLGIMPVDNLAEVEVALMIDLDSPVERMPEGPGLRRVAGVDLPVVALAGLEASAPLKVELALGLHGLP